MDSCTESYVVGHAVANHFFGVLLRSVIDRSHNFDGTDVASGVRPGIVKGGAGFLLSVIEQIVRRGLADHPQAATRNPALQLLAIEPQWLAQPGGVAPVLLGRRLHLGLDEKHLAADALPVQTCCSSQSLNPQTSTIAK